MSNLSVQTIKSDSPVPVREQLLTILVNEIKQKTFAPGQRFPSERELAVRYGISRTSVREAVAQMLAQGLLMRTTGRGTFVAEPIAINSALKTSRRLAFWISEEVFHFVQAGYNQILSGVTEICRTTGCQLIFHPVSEGAVADDFGNDLSPDGVSGSIVVGGLNRVFIQRLQDLGTPLILVDLLNSNAGTAVSIDYAQGTQSAIHLLAELGHREIGFIGFPNSPKYVSYWQSLQAYGFPYKPEYVEFLDFSNLMPSMLAGFRAMQKLSANQNLPTAMLVTNDYAATGVMEAATMLNISIPSDLNIIGYDDLGQTPTPLTTIRCDLVEVGRIAARKLIEWIDTERTPGQQTTVPVELVVRASTGPARKG